jgi:hypothetical protein
VDFQDVINEHLELRRRNARLEHSLPLDRYRSGLPATDPVAALPERFLDETEEVTPGWLPVREARGSRRESRESPEIWDVPPLFDWGD